MDSQRMYGDHNAKGYRDDVVDNDHPAPPQHHRPYVDHPPETNEVEKHAVAHLPMGEDDHNFQPVVENGVGAIGPNDTTAEVLATPPWRPTGNFWKDAWFFVGPGWLVSIAYIDPGNYQADIQAGASAQYSLLWAIWWSSLLSIYVQILCVRLAYYAQLTLAETQARDAKTKWQRYGAWAIAEFSTMITDLPEVIGMGIAGHYFFGWDYYVGVLGSLLTTMVFLATLKYGIQWLEWIVFGFVGIMSVALWMEMAVVGPDLNEIWKGWAYGFAEINLSDELFAIAGILGAVVMPHNLYLHTAAVQSRRVVRREAIVEKAVLYSSWEPVLPIVVSFFVNLAVVAIAAESVFGSPQAETVGLTDFCLYFQSLEGGCLLWGIALLAAGQSSAITTTFTGQYVMDGFLHLQLPVQVRALVTRLVAITPCVLVSVLFPDRLNDLINIVNAALSFLLPFALTPLIKYNCSPKIMGEHAAKGMEKTILYGLAILVWAMNAMALSVPGGGFFGDFLQTMEWSITKVLWIGISVVLQIGYAWWNFSTLFSPVGFVASALEDERPPEAQFAARTSTSFGPSWNNDEEDDNHLELLPTDEDVDELEVDDDDEDEHAIALE